MHGLCVLGCVFYRRSECKADLARGGRMTQSWGVNLVLVLD